MEFPAIQYGSMRNKETKKQEGDGEMLYKMMRSEED